MDFFKILHSERDQKLHEHYISGFSKNIFVWDNWVILGPKISHSHISLMDCHLTLIFGM